jgi:hypothetical protein
MGRALEPPYNEGSMRRGLHAIVVVVVFWATLSARAHADGAFPDSFAMFAPVDQSSTLELATNFGLVVSTDGAQSWHYVCENAVISFASLYSQGPDDTLYAVSTLGLVSSRDGGCSFTMAQGTLALSAVDDVFADPSDAMHVLAIARVVGDAGTAGNTRLYSSSDGARTFGDFLYNPASGQVLTGVEVAASDPKTVYLTMYSNGPHPFIARSDDGGGSFNVIDEGALGALFPRLLRVDPANPQRAFFRLGGTDGDALGITTDGGNTIALPLTVQGQMSAFLLRADGTILVGDNTNHAWRSTDGGQSFTAWPVTLHLRGLAERGTRLYAAADDVIDGAALWQSDDGGDTFTPILHFRDILGPLQCGRVPSTCAAPWIALQQTINPNFDGGLTTLDLSSADMPHHGGGHGCHFGDGSAGLLPIFCILLVAIVLRRRRVS